MSSGDQYPGGDNWGQNDGWGQDDDPWGQGAPPPPMPEQGSGWISPTQEFGGQPPGQVDPGSWDTGPPPADQGNWQWETAVPGAAPPSGAPQPTYEAGPAGYDPHMPPPGYDPNMPPPGYDPNMPPPQQPWDPNAPPPPTNFGPPPKKSNKGLIIGLTAGGGGLVVLVLIIVLALVFASGGGPGGEPGEEPTGGTAEGRKISWTVPEPDNKDSAKTLASFATADKKSFIRVSGTSITAYNLANGKQKWDIGAPEGQKVCTGTRGAPDGVAAIVYGQDGHCSTVAAVNVADGKQLWTASLKPLNEDFPPDRASAAAHGGKIWVSNSEQVFKFDAKKPPEQVEPSSAKPKDDNCSTGAVLPSDKGVLTTVRCLGNKYNLVALSSDSLKALWNTEIDSSSISIDLVAANPPTIHVDNASDNGELRVFDSKGKQKHVIQSRGEGGSLQLREVGGLNTTDLRKDYPVKQVGNTLVALAEEGESTDATNSMVGVDLTTGERSWVKKIKKNSEYSDIGWVDNIDPKKAMILDAGGGYGSEEASPQLFEVDPAKRGAMKASDTLNTGNSSSFSISSISTRMVVAGNSLVMIKQSPRDGEGLITAWK